MIYRSGKIAIAGVKSLDDANHIKGAVLNELARIGVSVPDDPKLVIWNIVGTADVGRILDIEALSERFYEDSEYLPEIFPGLVYRIPNSSLTVLAFTSGKLVLVGAKRVEDLQNLLNSFIELIDK
jgi:transcription initiation factor TFIID TATA-box-binding protein